MIKINRCFALVGTLFLISCDDLGQRVMGMGSNLDVMECIKNKNPETTGMEKSNLALETGCVEKFHKELNLEEGQINISFVYRDTPINGLYVNRPINWNLCIKNNSKYIITAVWVEKPNGKEWITRTLLPYSTEEEKDLSWVAPYSLNCHRGAPLASINDMEGSHVTKIKGLVLEEN